MRQESHQFRTPLKHLRQRRIDIRMFLLVAGCGQFRRIRCSMFKPESLDVRFVQRADNMSGSSTTRLLLAIHCRDFPQIEASRSIRFSPAPSINVTSSREPFFFVCSLFLCSRNIICAEGGLWSDAHPTERRRRTDAPTESSRAALLLMDRDALPN